MVKNHLVYYFFRLFWFVLQDLFNFDQVLGCVEGTGSLSCIFRFCIIFLTLPKIFSVLSSSEFCLLSQFASVCSPLTDLSLICSFFRDFSSPDLLRAPCFFSLTCLEHLAFFSDLLRAPCVAMIYWRKMGTVSDNWQLVGQQRLYCSGVLKRCLIQ